MTRKQARRRKESKPRKLPKFSLPIKPIAKVVVALAVVVFAYEFSARLLDQPIQAITIDGPFQRVSALQIEAAIGDELAQGFLSANLALIQTKIVALPWIDQANVARRWPGTLEIVVSEQVPAACWGEKGLLNVRGELFVDEARHVPAELPRLSGPEGRSADVASIYLSVREQLIPMGLDLRQVELDARGAWRVTLQNGVVVRLGRRDLGTRIALFIDVVANIVSSREADIEFVDMRYSNGFTIGWNDPQGAPQRAGPEAAIRGMVADTVDRPERAGASE